jgi:DNA-binding MarR family transcriptional regulator
MLSIPLTEIAANLNEVSWDIIDILTKNETLGYNDLRSKLGLSQEKVNSEIARLEGALLISSKVDVKDRRRILFNLTNYGLSISKSKN